MLTKQANAFETRSCSIKKDGFEINKLSDYFLQNSSICSFKSSDSWVVLSPIELSIKQKIEAIGTPLKDWDIQINYGIKTGFNEAFIIDGEKRAELIAADPKCAEIIRPILRGRDIKRYTYEFADLYIIATFPAKHYNIDDYPAIKAHLLSYGIERLEQTGKEYTINGEKIKARKKTNNQWFETQDSISYWDDFNKQKIVWIELTDHPNFALDEKGYFINNTVFFMTGKNLKYILAFLNSKLCEWYFDKICATSGVGTRRWIKMYIDKIRLPLLTDAQMSDISKYVDSYNGTDIDSAFYKIFSFGQDEIKVIEGN